MPGRILIVDAIAEQRAAMKHLLELSYYNVLQAETPAAALNLVKNQEPELIILNHSLNAKKVSNFCVSVKFDRQVAQIPVLIITKAARESDVIAHLTAGGDSIISEPLDKGFFLARVRSLLRARAATQELHLRDITCQKYGFSEAVAEFEPLGNVAIVVGQSQQAKALHNALENDLNAQITQLPPTNPLQALMNVEVPDLFILPSTISQSNDGMKLLAAIRTNPRTRDSAIIVLFPSHRLNEASLALDLGANDVVRMERNPQELVLRARAQLKKKRQTDQMRTQVDDRLRQAMIDPLTGLNNRRYAFLDLQRIANQSAQSGKPFVVMILDLDHFKSVNDTYGHQIGDIALQKVAACLRANTRSKDLLARIGGEEFLIATPGVGMSEARTTADRLRKVVEIEPITLPGSNKKLSLSASIGVVVSNSADPQIYTLIAQADAALYRAKSTGRNKVDFSRSVA